MVKQGNRVFGRTLPTRGCGAVLPFQPKHRLAHPGNYLFTLSKKIFLDQTNKKLNKKIKI